MSQPGGQTLTPSRFNGASADAMTKASSIDGMTITELADQLGTTVRALRYYEHVKLLRPDRNGGNARRYGADARARAELIVELRRVDVPMSEIKMLTQSEAGFDQGRIAAILQVRVAVVERQVQTLKRLLSAADSGLLPWGDRQTPLTATPSGAP